MITDNAHTAATSYASSFKNYLDTKDQERLKEAFTKGVEWAVTDPEILKGVLGEFAEWIDHNYSVVQAPNIMVTKYIQFIQETKQKEDGK